MDLVIMAAGLGSRFGGLKQLQAVDENNNFIIDYSIFDAIKAGFNHVVFIIKEELFQDFKNTIGNRIEKFVKVDYVFQNNKNIPSSFSIPSTRSKPFGTGHAILCAKDAISSDFAVINADDFYGRNAFEVAFNFLKNNTKENNYALIGYKAINTIAESGAVKRGICIHKQENLLDIIESSIEKDSSGRLLATPICGDSSSQIIENNQMVSMNLFAFSKNFLNYLDNYFLDFLNQNKNDLSSCEFFLPTVVSKLIKENKVSVKALQTTSRWFGITYKSDLEIVKTEIQNMKNAHLYPASLWN